MLCHAIVAGNAPAAELVLPIPGNATVPTALATPGKAKVIALACVIAIVLPDQEPAVSERLADPVPVLPVVPSIPTSQTPSGIVPANGTSWRSQAEKLEVEALAI